MKVLLEIRYTGENYHGWQAQRNASTVQKAVQNTAEEMLGDRCAVTGCSRTDAGVHAKRFFCTLDCPALDRFPLDKLPAAMNALLPPDIAAVSCRAVDGDFHPRYSALGKEYEYLIYNGQVRDPFFEGRAWMLPGRPLDCAKMQEEADKLVGRHDFTSFCAAGGKIVDKTRTVYDCRVCREGDLVRVTISADGFLYNMVRIIVGTLADCAAGRCGDCTEILAARERKCAGRTAPAHGLYLKRVFYDANELPENAGKTKEDPA